MWREAAKGICKAKRNNSLTVVSRDREKKNHTQKVDVYIITQQSVATSE